MMRTTDMTLYTNGETVWTYEQMRDVVFPAEIEGVDMDHRKVDEERLGRGRSESGSE
jgi:hypothetical protein